MSLELSQGELLGRDRKPTDLEKPMVFFLLQGYLLARQCTQLPMLGMDIMSTLILKHFRRSSTSEYKGALIEKTLGGSS